MTAFLYLGGSALLAHALMGPGSAPKVDPTPAEELDGTLLPQEELFMKDALEVGVIAPHFQSNTARVPWNTGSSAPYYVYQPGDTHLNRPWERTFEQIYNAVYHNRKDFEEAMHANRPQYARASRQPIWTGFTDEMTRVDYYTGDSASTQHMGWSWLGNNPTDADFNDAALLAKALPPDPTLFTPTADFATAPGLPFRYAPY